MCLYNQKERKLIKYGFLIVGGGILTLALFVSLNTNKLINKYVESKGVVVKLIEISSKYDEFPMYKPLVQFTDSKGNTVEFTTSTSSRPSSYKVGEKVDVLYAPENPDKAEINDFFSLWSGILMAGIFGAVFFTVGLVFFLFDKRKK